ncbi:MAG: O-antigen ligase family protein [Anaerolineales bacterium]|nr:O-antigen ligase family protein [Anaerolineales bacterium]
MKPIEASRQPVSRTRRFLEGLTQLELWVVAPLVAGGIISQRFLLPTLIAAGAFWLLRRAATGRWSLRTPLDWPMLVMGGMALLSRGVTANGEVTQPAVLRLLSGMALFYALLHWTTTPRRMARLVEGIRTMGLGLALIAPVSVQWATGKLPFIPAAVYDRFTLLAEDSVHPNILAGHLVVFLLWASTALFFTWPALSWLKRLYYTGAGLFILTILVLTQSRGAFIGLGVASLVLVLLRFRRGWIWASLALAVAGAAVFRFGLHQVLDVLTSGNTVSGLDGRLEVWSRAIYMLQDFPFTGVGMGMFGRLADALYPFSSYSPHMIDHAHNLFLQVGIDLGIPGLIAWLAIFGTVSWCAWQVYRAGRANANPSVAGIGAMALSGQIALGIHGLTDAATWNVRPAVLIWGLWGATLAAWTLYCGPDAGKELSARRATAAPEEEPNQPTQDDDGANDDQDQP